MDEFDRPAKGEPITDFELGIFVKEVRMQARFALTAYQDLQNIASSPKGSGYTFWLAAYMFLSSTAAVSRLFWPQNCKKRDIYISDRAEKLREHFGVDEDSILKSRKLRNLIEHFDEKLEKWARTSAHRNRFDFSFFSAGSVVGLNLEDYIRNFDAQNDVFTVYGESFEAYPILKAIGALIDVEVQPQGPDARQL